MNILYLTFYFEPDLSAGSFRNSTLVKELALVTSGKANIDVYTTFPNRYKTYKLTSESFENKENLNIYRIKIPTHNSGFLDQIRSFITYYIEVKKRTKNVEYDLVFASSSRLFTAFLGFRIAKNKRIPLYVDVRDIFFDSIKDLFGSNPIKWIFLPFLKYIEARTFFYATHINLISPGFRDYFKQYKNSVFTFFTNGIDEDFLNYNSVTHSEDRKKVILYAGNIGEGQGLHKFVPELAKKNENLYDFIIVGDGAAKEKLNNRLKELNCNNVIIKDPVSRASLMKEYENADFLLIHLNDYAAFKKVLPSKIFELGAIDKPIIAGVGGYAAEFIKENLSNVILIEPCDYRDCINKLQAYDYKNVKRLSFIQKFNRKKINEEMALSISSYL